MDWSVSQRQRIRTHKRRVGSTAVAMCICIELGPDRLTLRSGMKRNHRGARCWSLFGVWPTLTSY